MFSRVFNVVISKWPHHNRNKQPKVAKLVWMNVSNHGKANCGAHCVSGIVNHVRSALVTYLIEDRLVEECETEVQTKVKAKIGKFRS